MADRPFRPATRRRLGGPLHRQLADRSQDAPRAALRPFIRTRCLDRIVRAISQPFGWLFPAPGYVSYVLLTRLPLSTLDVIADTPLDLHVLCTLPALILSQDQTLH